MPLLCAPVVIATDLSVDAFAYRTGVSSARLSPDGTRIVYVAETVTGQQARVRLLETHEERTLLEGGGAGRQLRWCDWSGEDRVICGTAWVGELRGTAHEQTGLVAVDADGRARRTLMRDSGDPVRDRVIDIMTGDPDVVLVEHDEEGNGFPGVSRLETRSGSLRPLVRPRAPIRRWITDGRGLVRLGIGYADGIGSIYTRAAEGDEWDLTARHSLQDPAAWAPLAFGENAADLYALKLHDGRYALFHVDLNRDAALSLMYAHPEFDVSGPVLLDPRTRDLLAVRYVSDRAREHFFDAGEQTLQQQLDAALPDRVNLIVDRDRTGQRALVWSYSDSWPGSLHLLETEAVRVEEIGREYPRLDPTALGRTVPLAYHARDGQLIPAYLTVPRDRVPLGLPAVLLPHGGPEGRVEWGFDPLVQLLASRGYAVLQMNFRGSSGFGIGFLAAGPGQWGGVIHRDITDGAAWLVRQGIVDPDRVCIVGSSFGGYAALLGAVREPDTYRCAASQGGIADLNALVSAKQRFHYAEMWRQRIGEEHDVRAASSPIASVAQADGAILLVHGEEDVVVPVEQSRAMAEALDAVNKQYELAVLPGCGHDLVTARCREQFYQRLVDFLERQLAPLDD